MKRTGLATALAAAMAMMVTAGPVGAVELRAASGAPPVHPANDPMYTSFVAALAAQPDADITARLMGLEVATLREMVPNLQSGVLDVGNVLTAYFPGDFPQNNLLTDLAALGKNGQAMTGAVTEYTVNCPECLAEFTNQDMIYLGSSSTSTFWLQSSKPITSMADLKGLRVRAGAAPFFRWAEAMGLSPQNISFNEEFEALSTGLLDGTLAPPTNLTTSRLLDVIKYSVAVPIGTTHSAAFSIRKETWQSLNPAQKRALVKASLTGLASFAPAMLKEDEHALVEAKKAGVEVIDPPADIAKANLDYEVAAMEQAAKIGQENGIADAADRVARFAALVKKWRGLVEPIGNDAQAMADLMDKEIWSKVDLDSYGM